jgi:predicted RNA-binding Zn-ribbon protein involved in translation (DUF1610 family)
MKAWTCEEYGVGFACPECGAVEQLERDDGTRVRCRDCGVWFSGWRVEKVEHYTDPHVTRKCHEVARSYHKMRGDIS